MRSLYDELKLKKGDVCAFIGGGGKTTLIFELARECCGRVLISTTTKMYKPEEGYYQSADQIPDNVKYAVLGKEFNTEKICGVDEEERIKASANFDLTLIEADGSKRMPIKVHAAHEPVISADTTRIICVAGMDALDKKMKDVCFRCELSGISEDKITDEDLFAGLVERMCGNRECTVVLNKADSEELKVRARKIAELLDREVVIWSTKTR